MVSYYSIFCIISLWWSILILIMIIFIDNIINGMKNNINCYWNKKEEVYFYNDIKDKLLYFILTKKK